MDSLPADIVRELEAHKAARKRQALVRDREQVRGLP
jgi:hypothetical protein